MIEADLGGRCVIRDTSIVCKEPAANSVVALRGLVARWAADARPSVVDARRFATTSRRNGLSKFEPCVPEELLLDLAAERAVDREGARRLLIQAGVAR